MRLSTKLLLLFLPAAALSTAVLVALSRDAVSHVLVGELRATALQHAAMDMPQWRPLFEKGTEKALLPRLLDGLKEYGALYASALDENGRVLAHTDVAETGTVRLDGFTHRALAAAGPSWRELLVDGEPVLELSVPVWSSGLESDGFLLQGSRAHGGERLGTLRLGLRLASTLRARDRTALWVGLIVGLGSLLTLLAQLIALYKGIARPVEELSTLVERLARGELGPRPDRRFGGDEIGELARSFNRLCEDLARTTVSREQLAQVLRGTQDALFVTDVSRRIVMVNPAAAAMTGREEGELLGMPVAALFEGGAVAAFEHNAELLLKTKSGGTIPVLFSSAPMEARGQGSTGLVCAAKDITDRKRAEEAEALRERERLQKEFVATVSHELRTPIAAIKGFSETLLSGGLEDALQRESFVRTIDRNAARLSHLVENLLTVSALDAGRRKVHPEPLSLEVAIGDVAGTLEPLARRAGVRIRLSVEPALTVLADGHQLPRMLQNLLDNAIKFSARGGEVLVEARRLGRDALISVSDAGIGIAEEDLPVLFERFRRSERADARKVRGTGLGLSITKELVELHGGRIWAESRKGGGSTFHFTLPLEKETTAAA